MLGVAAGTAFWWGSLGFENVNAWFLPRVAGLAAMAFCLLELVFSIRGQSRNTEPAEDMRGGEPS